MKRNSVNILTAVNNKNISEQVIDGETHIVINGVVPIVDDVVMNGGLYPAVEIDKGYSSLEGNLMPLDHPQLDGKYISAQDVRAVNKFHVGAWAKNVRKENGKVLVDMYVNRRFAEGSENGKRLLKRLDEMKTNQQAEPIHVSTGLILNKQEKTGTSKGKKYRWVATNMQFDHIAILLDSKGAATPEDGVGIFVNRDGAEFDVENVSLETNTDTNVTTSDEQGLFQRFIAFLTGQDKQDFSTNGENVMKQKIINALNAAGIKVDGLTDDQLLAEYSKLQGNTQEEKKPEDEKGEPKDEKKPEEKGKEEEKDSDLDEKIKKAVNEALAPFKAEMEANQSAEEKKMREAVKQKFGMSDLAVNALAGEALKEFYAKTQGTMALNSGAGSTENQWDNYSLNPKEKE